jgi:TP901 family phage tail tape measure protein
VVNLGSSLADLANHTRGNASEMLMFSQRMSGTAVAIGMTAQEVLGLGAAVSAIGAQPELGASGITQTMTLINRAIQSGGQELRKFSRAMGITSEELSAMWSDSEQGPTAVLVRLLEELSRQGDGAAVTLQQLGLSGVGTTQVLGGLAAQLDVVYESLGMSNQAFEDGTAVGELAAVRFDTMIKSLQTFGQATTEVMRSLGDWFLPILKTAIDFMTGLVNIFNAIPQPVKSLIGVFLGFGGALAVVGGAFVLFFAKFHAFFALIHVIPLLINKVQQALLGMGGAAAGPAILSLERLGMVFQKLSNFFADFRGNIAQLIPALGERFVGALNRLRAMAASAAATMQNFWATMVGPRITAIGAGLLDSFAAVWPRLATGLRSAQAAMIALASTGVRTLQRGLASLAPMVLALRTQLAQLAATMGGLISTMVASIAAQAASALPQMSAMMANFGSVLTQALSAGFAGAAASARNFAAVLKAMTFQVVVPATVALRGFAIALTTSMRAGLASLLTVLAPVTNALRSFSAWLVTTTVHEMGMALRFLGSSAMFAGRALAPLMLKLAMIALPLALITGALLGGRSAWRAWTERNEEAIGPLEAAARAANLTYEAVDNLNRLLDSQSKKKFDILVDNKDLLQLLRSLDEDTSSRSLERFGMDLLAQGNSPEEVKSYIEDLGRLSGTPIVFQWTLEEISSGEGFERRLELASTAISDFISTAATGAGGRVETSRWSLRGNVTKEFEGAFNEQLNVINQVADENRTAGIALLLQAQDDLNQAFEEDLISRDVLRWASSQLDSLDILPERDRSWYERNLKGTLDQFRAFVFPEGSGLDPFQNFEPRDSSFVQEALAELADMEPENFPEFDQMLEVVREITGESRNLGDAIRNLDDGQVEELADRFSDLAIEIQNIDLSNLLDPDTFGTQLEFQIAQGFSLNDEDFGRYINHLFETFPQQVGYVQALEEAQTYLDGLVDTGAAWTEEAERARKAIKTWSEEFAKVRIEDLTREMNGLTAIEQVRTLQNELDRLDRSQPYSAQVEIHIRQVMQQTFEQAVGEFRQVMGQYDSLIDRREETIRSHQERLEQMEEDHGRNMGRMRENFDRQQARSREDHDRRLGKMEEQRTKSIEQANKQYKERLEDINDAEKKAFEQRAEQQARAFSIIERIQARPSASLGAMLENMRAQNAAMDEMANSVAQLRRMGLSADVMDALGFNDPANFGQVRRMLEMALSDPSMIQSINAEWGKRLKISEAFVEEVDRSGIEEGFEKQRKDALDALERQKKDINERHREQVAETRENFARQVADANENFARQVADSNENYARQVENANEQNRRQLDQIAKNLADLGQNSLETIDELIEKASESGLEKLREWAEEIESLRQMMAEDSRRRTTVNTSPAEVDRMYGITYDWDGDIDKSWRDLGRKSADEILVGYSNGMPYTWRMLQNDMRSGTGRAMDVMSSETSSGVRDTHSELRKVSDQDPIWNEATRAGRTGAGRMTSGIVTELERGTSRIDRVLSGWSRSIGDNLNPVLESIGQDPIVINAPSRGGRTNTGGGGMVVRAQGGIDNLPGTATIQPPGTLVQWAEPETGGEAFIPLAASKRERSRQIWMKTGEILGIDIGKLDPHSLHSYADGGFHNIPDMSDLGTIGDATQKAMEYVYKLWIQHANPYNVNLGPGGDAGRVSGGWQQMWKVLSQAFPGANLMSGYRPGAITATGRPSYHGMGRAIDVTPSTDIAEWIRRNFMAQTREMIYSPMNNRQVHNGRDHYYATPITRAMHWDHVHWAMAAGDILSDSMKRGVDQVPAWLSHGEFVMQAEAVKEYGLEMMEGMNARRYANGGAVGVLPRTRGREPMGGGQTDLVNALTKALASANLGRSETNNWDVKVEAQDTRTMIAELEKKRRLARLTGGDRDL